MNRRTPPQAGAPVHGCCLGSSRGFRHLRMAVGTMGNFAGCGQRVFRPLRRAGISRLARRDRGRCPLDPCNFLKKIE